MTWKSTPNKIIIFKILKLWQSYFQGIKAVNNNSIRSKKIRLIKKNYGNIKEKWYKKQKQNNPIYKKSIQSNQLTKLIMLANTRLDSILVHSRWTTSILEARHWIKKGQIMINNKIIRHTTYKPSKWDTIQILDTKISNMIKNRLNSNLTTPLVKVNQSIKYSQASTPQFPVSHFSSKQFPVSLFSLKETAKNSKFF